nr:hypothetical protein [Polyangiaceae bacterium]
MTSHRHNSRHPSPGGPRARHGGAAALALFTTFALGTLAGDGGCSLAVDASTSQCDVDAECLGKGLADTICLDNTCVRPLDYCQTNQECIDRSGGQPYVCVQKQCQSLLSDDCKDVIGTPEEYGNDNAVVIGYISLLAGNPLASQGLGGANAVELARGDFVRAFGGLPPAAPGGPVRPLVVVVCNELPDPLRPSRHLVETLKVPAVIGPLSSSGALVAAQQVMIPNNVLHLNPTATTLAMSQLEDRGLVWRTDAVDVDLVGAMGAFTSQLEAQLRGGAAPVVTGEDGLKVAYVHRGDILGTSVQSLFLDTLEFNGKKASANTLLNTYRSFDYGDFVDPATTAETTKRAVAGVIGYLPHVVLLFGLGEMVTTFSQIEQQWPANAPYRPYYVLHPAGFGGDWKTVIGSNEDLRRRVFGTLPFANPADPVGALIKSRYDGLYAQDTAAVWSTPAQAGYDNLYLFAYAAIANGNRPLTGPNLAESMKKIAPPGTAIKSSDTSTILSAVVELQAGRNIDYFGALGNIVFDDAGEFAPPVIIWCTSPAPDNRGRPSGLTFNKTTRQLEGTNTCVAAPAP